MQLQTKNHLLQFQVAQLLEENQILLEQLAWSQEENSVLQAQVGQLPSVQGPAVPLPNDLMGTARSSRGS